MTQWTFFGRVLPEWIPLNVIPEQPVELFRDLVLRYRIKAQIERGCLTVWVIVEEGNVHFPIWRTVLSIT
jgi:hypothetical protein